MTMTDKFSRTERLSPLCVFTLDGYLFRCITKIQLVSLPKKEKPNREVDDNDSDGGSECDESGEEGACLGRSYTIAYETTIGAAISSHQSMTSPTFTQSSGSVSLYDNRTRSAISLWCSGALIPRPFVRSMEPCCLLNLPANCSIACRKTYSDWSRISPAFFLSFR